MAQNVEQKREKPDGEAEHQLVILAPICWASWFGAAAVSDKKNFQEGRNYIV